MQRLRGVVVSTALDDNAFERISRPCPLRLVRPPNAGPRKTDGRTDPGHVMRPAGAQLPTASSTPAARISLVRQGRAQAAAVADALADRDISPPSPRRCSGPGLPRSSPPHDLPVETDPDMIESATFPGQRMSRATRMAEPALLVALA